MRWNSRVFGVVLFAASSVAAVAGEAYSVDLQSSRVYSRVDAVRIGHDHGIEGRLRSGSLDLAGAGQLVIDMATFTADTPKARSHVGLDGSVSASDRRQTTENMHSSDVLDVRRYPLATFDVTSVKPVEKSSAKSGREFVVAGQFTLHGVKRPVTFKTIVEPVSGNVAGALRMRGSFVVKQTDYGMTPYWALGGIVKISNEVTIWGDLLLVPTTAPVAQTPQGKEVR